MWVSVRIIVINTYRIPYICAGHSSIPVMTSNRDHKFSWHVPCSCIIVPVQLFRHLIRAIARGAWFSWFSILKFFGSNTKFRIESKFRSLNLESSLNLALPWASSPHTPRSCINFQVEESFPISARDKYQVSEYSRVHVPESSNNKLVSWSGWRWR